MSRAIRTGFLVAVALATALALSACGPAPDRDETLLLRKAQARFLQSKGPEDYLEVASLYQEVLDRGFVNGAVFFNQGNAFMRAGRRGEAVAAYEQALRYRPRDRELRANLDLARGGAKKGSRSLIDTIFFWQDMLSYPGKFQAAALAGAAALLLGLAGLVRAGSAVLRRAALLSLLITLILCASAGLDWMRFGATRHGVVIAAEAVARKGNAESFAPAFTRPLEEGTEFTLREERGEWLLIRLEEGPEAWIRRDAARLF